MAIRYFLASFYPRYLLLPGLSTWSESEKGQMTLYLLVYGIGALATLIFLRSIPQDDPAWADEYAIPAAVFMVIFWPVAWPVTVFMHLLGETR